MMLQKLTRRLVDKVAAFGNRERNNARFFRRHFFDRRFTVRRRINIIDQRSNHPRILPARAPLNNRIKVVLPLQRIPHPIVAGQHSHAAFAPTLSAFHRQQIVQVHRLMRTMKSSYAHMHGVRPQRASIVQGQCDIAPQL